MAASKVPHHFFPFTAANGGETSLIVLESGDYIARNARISNTGNSVMHSYFWSMRDIYNAETYRNCKRMVDRIHPGYERTVARSSHAYILIDTTIDAAGQELAGHYNQLRQICHRMPHVSISWEAADFPPTDYYEQRAYSGLVDESTHEMSYVHQDTISTTHVEWLAMHTGSFTVKRALPLALELFRQTDYSPTRPTAG